MSIQKNKIKLITFMLSAIAVLGFSGCGRKAEQIRVIHTDYESSEIQVGVVKKGELSNTIEIPLLMTDYESIQYTAAGEKLKLEEVLVSLGDEVKEGDVLVKFSYENASEAMESYQAKIDSNNIEIEHYEKLMSIDKNQDYSLLIQRLKEDNEVYEIYINEAIERQNYYQIVASRDGFISMINRDLLDDTFHAGQVLINEVGGSGVYQYNYYGSFEFKVGEAYKASGNNAGGRVDADLILLSAEEETDAKGNQYVHLEFQYSDGVSFGSAYETLYMKVEESQAGEVTYIEKEYIYENEEGEYVYVMDDDGNFSIRHIKTSGVFDKYSIISEGLSEGEKVVKN